MCDNVQPLMHCQISCYGGGRGVKKMGELFAIVKEMFEEIIVANI